MLNQILGAPPIPSASPRLWPPCSAAPRVGRPPGLAGTTPRWAGTGPGALIRRCPGMVKLQHQNHSPRSVACMLSVDRVESSTKKAAKRGTWPYELLESVNSLRQGFRGQAEPCYTAGAGVEAGARFAGRAAGSWQPGPGSWSRVQGSLSQQAQRRGSDGRCAVRRGRG